MHCRRLKCFKIFLIVFCYCIAYYTINHFVTPILIYHFVPDELRVGEKYVFIYLIAKAPAFSDADGVNVFRTRGSGRGCRSGLCFITNNEGFMPLSQYDAVVIHDDKQAEKDTLAFVQPMKLYTLVATRSCLQGKLLTCDREPTVVSYATQRVSDLCELCEVLHKQRECAKQGFSAIRLLTSEEKCI